MRMFSFISQRVCFIAFILALQSRPSVAVNGGGALVSRRLRSNMGNKAATTTGRAELLLALRGIETLDSSAIASGCQYMDSCQKCASSPDCGWCGDCGRCVEGGSSGPSASQCLAWDYDICSGSDAFADASLKSHQLERASRDEQVARFKLERANYERATADVARLIKLVDAAAQAQQNAENGFAGAKQLLLPAQKSLDSKDESCKASTRAVEKKSAKVANMTSSIAALQASKAAAETARNAANTAGDPDKANELQAGIDATEKEIASMKLQSEREKISLTMLKSAMAADCNAKEEANGRVSKVQESIASSQKNVDGAKGQLAAAKTALKNAQQEHKRARAAAISASERVKQISIKLADLRAQQTASNRGGCMLEDSVSAAANAAIKEWKECVDCQKKATA